MVISNVYWFSLSVKLSQILQNIKKVSSFVDKPTWWYNHTLFICLSVKRTVRLHFVDFLLILPIGRRVIKAQLSISKTRRKMTRIQTFQLVLPIGKWTLFVCIITTIYRQNNLLFLYFEAFAGVLPIKKTGK